MVKRIFNTFYTVTRRSRHPANPPDGRDRIFQNREMHAARADGARLAVLDDADNGLTGIGMKPGRRLDVA